MAAAQENVIIGSGFLLIFLTALPLNIVPSQQQTDTIEKNQQGTRMFDFSPEKTYTRTEVMSRPTPVPALNGVYFWWFKEIPPGVPTEGSSTAEGAAMAFSERARVPDSPALPLAVSTSVSKTGLLRGNTDGSASSPVQTIPTMAVLTVVMVRAPPWW